ncbi:MAG: SGNH/GDSL hydrolase family protein [Spirochaetales bacterium]|jgi:lysophospholipase L1-like esterase|nr:SGNH/GDSL hydrolase family protein [Spirochaetales bacterium]
MKIDTNTTLLFIGDSITDTGRVHPVGERDGLGDGYVSITDGLLGAHYPERKIRVLNTGISGNRITDLKERWSRDVLALKPDWLSIMIGINDVWRQFDNPLMSAQVEIEMFESVYIELIEQTLPSLKGLILLTPYFIEPNREDDMRVQMDAYGMVVRGLAAKYGALFGDTQAAFDRYLEYNPTQTLCGDRVHPNRKGHSIITSSFLNAVGFEWSNDL